MKGAPAKRYFTITEDSEKLVGYLERGREKARSLANPSDTSVGGNLKRRGKELDTPEGSANNTNNNTKHNTKDKKDNKGAKIASFHTPLSFMFIDLYNEIFKEEHPYIKREQLIRAEETITDFLTEFDLGIEHILDIAGQYFNSTFSKANDYHINHFASREILIHMAQQAGEISYIE